MKRRIFPSIILGIAITLWGCAPVAVSPSATPMPTHALAVPPPTEEPTLAATDTPEPVVQPFTLTSPVLEAENMIPTLYSCDGKDISLPLTWGDPPEGTKSFALIMEDPDARAVSGIVWIHWVLFNLPPQTRALPENSPKTNTLADGSIQGKNSFGKIGYGGPCPPSGKHHYVFKLYALDSLLNAPSGTTSGVLVQKMQGHILAQTELVTTYRRH